MFILYIYYIFTHCIFLSYFVLQNMYLSDAPRLNLRFGAVADRPTLVVWNPGKTPSKTGRETAVSCCAESQWYNLKMCSKFTYSKKCVNYIGTIHETQVKKKRAQHDLFEFRLEEFWDFGILRLYPKRLDQLVAPVFLGPTFLDRFLRRFRMEKHPNGLN